MRRSLTLPQRAMIPRLREAGYNSLADCAADAWPNGEPCNVPPSMIKEPELRASYERANAHASEPA